MAAKDSKPALTPADETHKKKEPEKKILTGHYHNLWDTQMGEQTVNLSFKDADLEAAEEQVSNLKAKLVQQKNQLADWSAQSATLTAGAAAESPTAG